MNFLEYTVHCIEFYRHNIGDIFFIGNIDGYTCTWEEFTKLADFEFDPHKTVLQTPEIATDLIIVFNDGTEMWCDEDDWQIKRPFVIPANKLQINSIRVNGWRYDLSEIHYQAE